MIVIYIATRITIIYFTQLVKKSKIFLIIKFFDIASIIIQFLNNNYIFKK